MDSVSWCLCNERCKGPIMLSIGLRHCNTIKATHYISVFMLPSTSTISSDVCLDQFQSQLYTNPWDDDIKDNFAFPHISSIPFNLWKPSFGMLNCSVRVGVGGSGED